MARDPARQLRRLPPGARRDLLRVLESDSRVRADVIRQFHERGYEDMVETLTMLEAGELLRLQVIEAVRRTLDWPVQSAYTRIESPR